MLQKTNIGAFTEGPKWILLVLKIILEVIKMILSRILRTHAPHSNCLSYPMRWAAWRISRALLHRDKRNPFPLLSCCFLFNPNIFNHSFLHKGRQQDRSLLHRTTSSRPFTIPFQDRFDLASSLAPFACVCCGPTTPLCEFTDPFKRTVET